MRDAAEVVAAHWRRGRVARRFAAWRRRVATSPREGTRARGDATRGVGRREGCVSPLGEPRRRARAHKKRVAFVARRARREVAFGATRAFEAWRFRAFRSVAARAKKDAEEAAFVRDALGGERERRGDEARVGDAPARVRWTLASSRGYRRRRRISPRRWRRATRKSPNCSRRETSCTVDGTNGRRRRRPRRGGIREDAARKSTGSVSSTKRRTKSRRGPSPPGDERRVLEWESAEPPESDVALSEDDISEDDDPHEPYAQSPPAMLTAYADRDAADSFASPKSLASKSSSPAAPASSSPPVSSAQSRLDRALRTATPTSRLKHQSLRNATPTSRLKHQSRTRPRRPPDRFANVRGESPIPAPSPRLAVRPTARTPTSRTPNANAGGGPGTSPRRSTGSSPLGPSPRAPNAASASARSRCVDPSFYAKDAAARARGSIRDEDDVFGVYEDDDTFGAPLAYARVRRLDPEVDGALAKAVLSPVADARALVVVSDRGGVPFRQSFAFDRIFWGEGGTVSDDVSDDVSEDVSLGVVASAVAAPMFDAVAKTGRDATLLVVGAPGWENNRRTPSSPRSSRASRPRWKTTATANDVSRCACPCTRRGLVADDLLASFGGAADSAETRRARRPERARRGRRRRRRRRLRERDGTPVRGGGRDAARRVVGE